MTYTHPEIDPHPNAWLEKEKIQYAAACSMVRECAFCGDDTEISQYPTWLYELMKLADYKIIMCKGCFAIYTPGLSKAVTHFIDKQAKLIKERV